MPRWSEASQDTSQPGARTLFSAQTENRATRGRSTSIVVKCCTNDTGRVSNLPRTSPGLVYMSLVGSSMRWQIPFIAHSACTIFLWQGICYTHSPPFTLALLHKGVPDTGRPATSNMHRLYHAHAAAGQALAFWWEIGYTGCVIAYGR